MNATVFPGVKLAALLVVLAMVFSGFIAVAEPAQPDVEDVIQHSLEDVDAYADTNAVPADVDALPQPVVTQADGRFSPEPLGYGEANVLLIDDDAETWMSGPYLEASHVETALNDGGYVYDVFRAGRHGGAKELPSGDTGLKILDDYEVIIWYSGWNQEIVSSSEQSVMMNYLDGDCGSDASTCVPSNRRNVIQLTQMADWLHAYGSTYRADYLMYTTRGTLIVDGTSDPMRGVDGSIFDNKEFSASDFGLHYLDRPLGTGTSGKGAQGAFWFDQLESTSTPYHAIQYPRTDGQPNTNTKTHKSFLFANEIGVFDSRSERADFFATILEWMEVDPGQQRNVDVGIGVLEIPNHSQYWRSIEANVPIEIKVGVTNYGFLPQDVTSVHLKLKNQFGQILFDNIFSSAAFPEGHPMYMEQLLPGETWVCTFNKTNDRIQRAFDGLNPNKARNVIFTSAGMDTVVVKLIHTGDQVSPNNYMQAQVGISKWIDNYEMPENELGASMTIYDTDDNSNSLDHVNNHRVHSYDWDDDEDYPGGSNEGGGTPNETKRSTYHEGEYGGSMFNKNGWWKSSANDEKFTGEANQDDVFQSPAMDWSAMEEVIFGIVFTGRMESGDYWRMQMSKDGTSWTNLISGGGSYGKGDWYLWGGSNARYQGYVISSSWYGAEDCDTIYMRWQSDYDSDEVTESGSTPYMGRLSDEIVIRGTERITRDVAITDITVREDDFIVKPTGGSNDREINATVLNAGEASWTNLAVKFTATNLQGEDVSHAIDNAEPTIASLPGNSIYGDIESEGSEDEKDIFVLFTAPGANTYYMDVEVLVPAGKDFFPWNNSMRVTFRVFDTFFDDTMESGGITWTPVNRIESDNEFKRVDARDYDAIGDAFSGDWVRWYVDTTNMNSNAYAKSADTSFVTPDTHDRDGSGENFDTDVCVDLRAAFLPVLSFMLKYDLGSGDRLEIRAATDFDSSQKISSGTWDVLATYEGTSNNFPDDWTSVEISLADYEGYQTYLDFHVVANGDTDVGTGVVLDDVMIIGNEYRNNIDIVEVDTNRFTAAGKNHDLKVVIKSVGTEPQSQIGVMAQITKPNPIPNQPPIVVWPSDGGWNFFAISASLNKGDTYTVSPAVAGSDWRWGANMDPGFYLLTVKAERADEDQVPDESPAGNIKTYAIALGATLLSGDQWDSDDWDVSGMDGRSVEGGYSWDGGDSGTLLSESFTVWNSRPYLMLEAEYELVTANVRAQVMVETPGRASSGWVDVEWHDVADTSSLYAITGKDYGTILPYTWTDSSYFDNATRHGYWADLGIVDDISDGSRLQEIYQGGTMTVRLVGTSGGGAGYFNVWNPSVFGMDSYAMDLRDITPTSQKAEPSSLVETQKRTFTVEMKNLGAIEDSGVVDFLITVPAQSQTLKLNSGGSNVEDAYIGYVMEREGTTYVALTPAANVWQDTSLHPIDPMVGMTAYVAQDGTVTWPSGLESSTTAPGWVINNPTKALWDSSDDKPFQPNAINYRGPGQTQSVDVETHIGYAEWAPPGTYTIQADVRSWEDYENTFTADDPDGQAQMTIDKPDLYIGHYEMTRQAFGLNEAGVGWVKHSGGEDDPYFYFEMEVLNAGTDTIDTFKVGVLNFESNPLGVQVALLRSGTGWNIDASRTTATDPELKQVGGKQYILFKATAVDLGIEGPQTGKDSREYGFFLAVDTEENIVEQNEHNNKEAFSIVVVAEKHTTPSFGLSARGLVLSGLLAAAGVSMRRRDEEDEA